jgi:hypothetical protein
MAKKSFLIPTVIAVASILGVANAQASVPNVPIEQGLTVSAQSLAESPLNVLMIENSASSTRSSQYHSYHSSHASHASHASHYSSR